MPIRMCQNWSCSELISKRHIETDLLQWNIMRYIDGGPKNVNTKDKVTVILLTK